MLDFRARFNSASIQDSSKEPDLTLAIRSDAPHASRTLGNNIKIHLQTHPDDIKALFDTEEKLDDVIHGIYTKWLNDVVGLMATHLDKSKYKLEDNESPLIEASYYSAVTLEELAVEKAKDLVTQTTNHPPIFISLDDMIGSDSEHWSEIAFSRKFSLKGDEHYGYVGRPQKDPIEEQLNGLAASLKNLQQDYDGEPVPLVLMEDNVRHAKMLNWVIDLMDQHGVFDHAELKGISTCFCCASDEEKQKIVHNGDSVPVVAVLDFAGKNMDVITPRDLLVDGYVVGVEYDLCRLPAIFMDVASLMKIDPDQTLEFKEAVVRRNIEFCEELEQTLGFEIPLEWFIGAHAISHVMKIDKSTSMLDTMKQFHAYLVDEIHEQDNGLDSPNAQDQQQRQTRPSSPPQGQYKPK